MRITLMLVLTALCLGGCATRKPEPETSPAFEEILKIDLHAHIFEFIPGFAELLSRNRLCMLNICVPGSDPVQVKWMEETAELLYQKFGSIHPFASTFPLDTWPDTHPHNSRLHPPALHNLVASTTYTLPGTSYVPGK